MQTALFSRMTNNGKKEFAAIEADALDAVNGGWSLGGYVSGSISGFGVSKSITVDTSGNVYTTTGTGPTFPGIGVSAGGFYSNGTPQDHFAGDGISTTVGAGKTGVEVGTSESGQNIGVSLGVGVSPVNSADTHSEQAGSVGDYVGGTPDPTAYDAMGNYTGVGTGDPHAQDAPHADDHSQDAHVDDTHVDDTHVDDTHAQDAAPSVENDPYGADNGGSYNGNDFDGSDSGGSSYADNGNYGGGDYGGGDYGAGDFGGSDFA